ncbi:hypothetical protein HanXRQr2_Chr13g0609291 [Helianthus annuus]|uniref:Uncharacterized protein n=1 Tax=Helianthus annuus TaxID=4232 RepID=A0A9K3ENI8_HELAN|nr:hypothetical protein HanXRQr2_Chr13g0609291 [Helianthus annuus]
MCCCCSAANNFFILEPLQNLERSLAHFNLSKLLMGPISILLDHIFLMPC